MAPHRQRGAVLTQKKVENSAFFLTNMIIKEKKHPSEKKGAIVFGIDVTLHFIEWFDKLQSHSLNCVITKGNC